MESGQPDTHIQCVQPQHDKNTHSSAFMVVVCMMAT